MAGHAGTDPAAWFLFMNDTRAQSYLPHLHDRQWLISFMTEAELEQWALLAGWRPKRIEWLRAFLRRLGKAGAWIAATAALYIAPLLTHNVNDDLAEPGLQLITEAGRWSQAPSTP